jgi:hypothetical protein
VAVKVAGQEVKVDSRTGQMKELTPEAARKWAYATANGYKRYDWNSAHTLRDLHIKKIDFSPIF